MLGYTDEALAQELTDEHSWFCTGDIVRWRLTRHRATSGPGDAR